LILAPGQDYNSPMKKALLITTGLILVAAAAVGAGFMFDRGSYIGLVEVKGTLVRPDKTVRWIDQLAEDNRVKVILVKVDSPGGGVVAADEIYRALLRAKKEHHKPVVVYMGAIAASGGYYISCAGDSIIASGGTMTGSIGVIMNFPVIEGTMKKIGAEVEVIKSGQYKDIASPFRERAEDEKVLLKGTVMDVYDQFVDVVAKERGLPRDSVLSLADGRIFTGRQAEKLGLVDRVGSFHDAAETARRMGKLKDVRFLKRPKKKGLIYLLFGDEDEEDLLGKVKTVLTPALEYRWSP